MQIVAYMIVFLVVAVIVLRIAAVRDQRKRDREAREKMEIRKAILDGKLGSYDLDESFRLFKEKHFN